MRVDVHAVGPRELALQRGWTQRQLARNLRVGQNYLPATEPNDRRQGPRLQHQLMTYFGCSLGDLFRVSIDLASRTERIGEPTEAV